MIKIFTDSTSYIPKDIQLEFDITVLPLIIEIDGSEIPETQISNERFYNLIKKTNKFPNSKALETDEILSAFEPEVQKGNMIIAIFLSSKISDTYQNALTAKEKLIGKYSKANITIIDSQSAAMEEGLAVISAAEATRKNSWLEEIIKTASETIYYTKFLFIPTTLKYLEISGRIGKAQSILGNALQITPILTTQNGVVAPVEVIMSKSRALNKIFEIFKSDMELYGIQNIIVHHIDCIDEAMKIANKLEKIARLKVSICDIGPVVGANVGPGAIGLVYRTIKRLPEKNTN